MPAFVPAMIRAVCGWAEPELLDTPTRPVEIALMGCPDRVGLVTGRAETGPVALLVRPDGYVAWGSTGVL
ncbi:MAG TPA: FAD-dependent oxidoreductase, partial [Pseudonocardiaceae bacterium]|nr:FAD-dependent oxidoreductase [Pseudonocardiaceae bacterium]